MIFLSEWNRNDPKETWSGTTFQLMQSLNKLCDIELISIKEVNQRQHLFLTIQNIISNKSFQKNNNFNIYFQKYNEKKIIKEISKKDIRSQRIFQVGDLISYQNSFIYQDLSISFLLWIREHHYDIFQKSGFQKISINDLKKRNDIQVERYRKASKIFTMSHWLREFLINHDGYSEQKIIYAGAGINTHVKQIIFENKKRNKILFVGKDFDRKGGNLLLEAFKKLRLNYLHDAQLYLIGPDKIKNKEKIEGVHFLGNLNRDQTSKYFELCDIFCMPSKFEAYGIVYIEALCAGLPCIGMNNFEAKNIIKDGFNGYLLNDFDSEKLALKIFLLLNNNDIFLNVINKQDFYSKKYSWEHVAKRILESIRGNL